jgi:sirohydrochlorin ferrochelatase
MSEALLIVGHGSRDRDGVDEFLALGRMLAERRPGQRTAVAFLEFARPNLGEAIDGLVAQGAVRITCQPAMLLGAKHVAVDVPREVQAAADRWPHVTFHVGDAIDVHDGLLELCRLRWDDALRGRTPRDLNRTLLLLAGRGATDRYANARFAATAQWLGEQYGVGSARACFSGLAAPLVPDALTAAAGGEFDRIVVQPYFLFTGVLVKKVHEWACDSAKRHAGLDIISTAHLGVHALVANAIEHRASVAQSLAGRGWAST